MSRQGDQNGQTDARIEQTLERLRELEAKARKAPWRAAPGKGTACLVSEAKGEECQIYLNVRTAELDETVKTWQDTAAFIAELRNALPALLAHIESLQRLHCDCDEESGRHDPSCIVMIRELNQTLQSLADQRGRDLVEMESWLPGEGEHGEKCGVYDGLLCGCIEAQQAAVGKTIRERNSDLFKGS